MAEGHHLIPRKTLITVFLVLVGLTALTYITAEFIDLGVLEVPLALAIAATKAGFVVAVFMGLRWDNRVNLLIFTVGVLFVLVFTVFTLFDTEFRPDDATSDQVEMVAPAAAGDAAAGADEAGGH